VTQSGSDATFTGAVFDAATGTRIATERAVLSVESASFGKGLDELITRVLKAAETGKPSGPAETAGSGGGAAFGLSGSGGGQPPPPVVTTTPVPIEDPGTPATIYLGWTLVGVGAAGVIMGAVFGGLAKATYDDFRQTQQTSIDLVDLQDTGKTWSLAADLSYGIGGAFAAGGAAVLLYELYRAPSASDVLKASAGPIPGGGVVSIGGSF
jgi:hypothetical protein